MENSQIRLSTIMNELGIRQVDLYNKCKIITDHRQSKPISKSQISDWLHGRYEPNQWSLNVLAEALNVNEAWLMGLDVPKYRKSTSAEANADLDLLDKFSRLSVVNQQIVLTLIDNLLNAQ